jgi:hypothetical protein
VQAVQKLAADLGDRPQRLVVIVFRRGPFGSPLERPELFLGDAEGLKELANPPIAGLEVVGVARESLIGENPGALGAFICGGWRGRVGCVGVDLAWFQVERERERERDRERKRVPS